MKRTTFDHLSIARGRPYEGLLPRQRRHLNVAARARRLKDGVVSWASVLDEPLRREHGRLRLFRLAYQCIKRERIEKL